MTSDPVVLSDEIDRRILAISEDRVFRKSTVVAGFLVLVLALTVGFGFAFSELRQVTTSTNRAVSVQVPGLEQQVKARDKTIAEQEDVIGQATDAIILLLDLLREHGIEAPPIRISPGE